MKSDQSEFDFNEGRRRAEEGMTRAEASVLGKIWSAKATSEFDTWPSGTVFDSDYLTSRPGVGLPGTPGNKAVGGWFGNMSRKKKIICIEDMHTSSRVTRHGGLQRKWVKA
jgi:hypothetical protein